MKTIIEVAIKTILIILEVSLFFVGLMSCQPQMNNFWFLGLLAMFLGTVIIHATWKKVEFYLGADSID